uniref:Chloroplast protein-transporting ATPase n=1 Tax=Acrobeloides nanus TaxID=290746 RepID=A0A914CE12_9BILA
MLLRLKTLINETKISFETNKNKLLMQLATGEGKSIVIAIIAIMKAISEEKVVHIVTSSKLLAQRDAGANNITTESSQNLKDLYEIFGIKVDHNCYEDINARRRVYKECNVIYGNLECFQRDYLEDIFYNKKLLISKQQEIVIVDEVDSMLLDKSNYVFYLSKEIAGMDRLDTLFKHIWACVNRPLPDKIDGHCG